MLKIETINALQANLIQLLNKLQAREIDCIEYGDPKWPSGSTMSHLRIYYLPTPGGEQFTCKQISQHVEGSGFYTHDLPVIVDHAMNAVIHYHRPTSLRHMLEPRMPEQPTLSFFPLMEVDLVDSRKRANSLIAYRMGRDLHNQ